MRNCAQYLLPALLSTAEWVRLRVAVPHRSLAGTPPYAAVVALLIFALSGAGTVWLFDHKKNLSQ